MWMCVCGLAVERGKCGKNIKSCNCRHMHALTGNRATVRLHRCAGEAMGTDHMSETPCMELVLAYV